MIAITKSHLFILGNMWAFDCVCTCKGQRSSWELELQMTVRHHVGAGTITPSSAKTSRVLNHWAIAPASHHRVFVDKSCFLSSQSGLILFLNTKFPKEFWKFLLTFRKLFIKTFLARVRLWLRVSLQWHCLCWSPMVHGAQSRQWFWDSFQRLELGEEEDVWLGLLLWWLRGLHCPYDQEKVNSGGHPCQVCKTGRRFARINKSTGLDSFPNFLYMHFILCISKEWLHLRMHRLLKPSQMKLLIFFPYESNTFPCCFDKSYRESILKEWKRNETTKTLCSFHSNR